MEEGNRLTLQIENGPGGSPGTPRSVGLRSDRSRSSGGPRTDRSGGGASAMLEVKNSRKRAEADMKLLANRIALLRVIPHPFLSIILIAYRLKKRRR